MDGTRQSDDHQPEIHLAPGAGGVELAEKKPPGVSWLSPGSLPKEHHLLPHARRE